MKVIRYKKVQVNKPDNISITTVKKIIDQLGGDYCFSVDALIQFLSKNNIVHHEQR